MHRVRQAAAALSVVKRTHGQIAELLQERPTTTAVQRALSLHQQLADAGAANPYVLVEAPTDRMKLRRHKHPRYQFVRADGYQPLPL